MASREGQGLQIAVIMFAMLTIVLAITTYVFYAQSEDNRKQKEDIAVTVAERDTQNNKLMYEVAQLKFVLGLGNITDADLDLAKSKAGGSTTTVDEVKAAFAADMALFASNVAPTEARNYRTLPVYLLKEINRKHEDTDVALKERTAAEQAKVQAAAADAGRVKVAEDSIAKATSDLETLRTSYTEDRATLTKTNEDLAGRLTKKDADYKKAQEDYQRNLLTSNTLASKSQDLVNAFKTRIDAMEKGIGGADLFESPDGRVTWVNQKQQLCWINLGRADGLERQTTFSVYDHNEQGVSSAKAKGRIEVVTLRDDHLAECKILEDSVSNPILPNDVIHSPTWSPGQRVHFALVGFMDINGDHVSDRALVRNIITMNGGVIDAELSDDGKPTGAISVETRYLVTGEKPTEKAAVGGGSLSEYGNMIQNCRRITAPSRSPSKSCSIAWAGNPKSGRLNWVAAVRRIPTSVVALPQTRLCQAVPQ